MARKRMRVWFPVLLWLLLAGCEADDGPWVVNADISGNSAEALYVAGYVTGCSCEDGGFVKRYANGSWSTAYETDTWLWGVWVGEQGEVAAVGEGAVVFFENGAWRESSIEVLDSLQGVWGTGLSDLFAVGQEGSILHYDGLDWVSMESPVTENLEGVWGTASNDVFAVGRNGAILHYDGTGWSDMGSGTTEDLNAVWGLGPDDVYAVGGSETTRRHVIVHYDGTGWTPVREGEPFHLLGIHGTAPDNIYAVGAERAGDDVKSAVLRFDGAAWTKSTPKTGQFLWNVWAHSGGGATVVGPDNTLKRLK